MRRISIAKLKDIAKIRPSGYLEDCLSRGKDDGEFLILEDAIYAELIRKYRGLGDAVAAIAKPTARVIDRVLGTDLVNCGGCAKRQTKLNQVLPFKSR